MKIQRQFYNSSAYFKDLFYFLVFFFLISALRHFILVQSCIHLTSNVFHCLHFKCKKCIERERVKKVPTIEVKCIPGIALRCDHLIVQFMERSNLSQADLPPPLRGK